MSTLFSQLQRVKAEAVNPAVKADVVVDTTSGKIYVRLTIGGTAALFDGTGVKVLKDAIGAANQMRAGQDVGQRIKASLSHK